MIPAAKNRYVTAWFRGYVRRYLRQSFHRVLVAGELPATPEVPVLVCLSHSSWWDMLIAFWASHDLLGWDGFGPMDERQLRRYGILRRIGVFGVDRESLSGGREFLAYTRELAAGRQRAIWITSQGAMVSSEERPIRLYSGIAHLARAVGRCNIVTAAIQYEFWEEKRPEVFLSLSHPRLVDATLPGFSPKALLRELEGELEARMDVLAELRRQRDVSQFRVALSGQGGISPTYDWLRQMACRVRGERMAAEHGALATPPRWGPAGRRER
jgi:1-acyl-sn-glycerol-3-phosphate acyltransferase